MDAPHREPILAQIDDFNAQLAALKLEAARALLDIAKHAEDPAERRRAASTLIRATFQRYPNAAACPQPPTDPDDNAGDDEPNQPPPPPPTDELLKKAYDHGYGNGYCRAEKYRLESLRKEIQGAAVPGPGRDSPLPSSDWTLPDIQHRQTVTQPPFLAVQRTTRRCACEENIYPQQIKPSRKRTASLPLWTRVSRQGAGVFARLWRDPFNSFLPTVRGERKCRRLGENLAQDRTDFHCTLESSSSMLAAPLDRWKSFDCPRSDWRTSMLFAQSALHQVTSAPQVISVRRTGGDVGRLFLYAIFAIIFALPTQPTEARQTWSERSTGGPSPRKWPAMAYDVLRDVTVLFGGFSGGFSNETWQWNGDAWIQRSVSGPTSRSGAAMSFDAARGVIVLFGGNGVAGNSSETWEWNGADWTQRFVNGPSGRTAHAMVYDSIRHVVVLFGGDTSGTGSPSGETWEWNGVAWSQRLVFGPSPRYYHSMAFDTARGVTVLFGGYNANTENAETWEWNGTAWSLRSAGGPSPRRYHSMVYDSKRRVTVLHGGGTDGGLASGDTWEWNGVAWNQRAISGPGPRYSHALAYDEARSAVVMFGGGVPGLDKPDTWELRCAWPSTQPVVPTVCPTDAATLVTSATGAGPFVYRWQRESVPGSGVYIDLSNGTTSGWDGGNGGAILFGATTASLLIVPDLGSGRSLSAAHAIRYRCVVTNQCGITTSKPVQLVVQFPCGPADISSVGATFPNGLTCPDGQLTIEDFLIFLSAFGDAAGCPGTSPCNPADICGVGATYYNGVVDIGPDGELTIEDFLIFLTAFGDGAGCP